MIIKNPTTNKLFYSNLSEMGFSTWATQDDCGYVYDCVDGQLIPTPLTNRESPLHGYAATFTGKAYAIEIDEDKHIVPYKDGVSSIAFNILEISFDKQHIKYQEKICCDDIDYANFVSRVAEYQSDKISNEVKEMMEGLNKALPQYHLSDIYHKSVLYNSKKYQTSIFLIIRDIITHIRRYESNKEYKCLTDNGFAFAASEFVGPNSNIEIHYLYGHLYNRKLNELNEEEIKIIKNDKAAYIPALTLFFDYGFHKKSYTAFKRVFHKVNDASIKKYKDCKNYIDPHNEMDSDEIMKIIDKMVHYSTANQVIDVLNALNQMQDVDTISTVCQRTADFSSLLLYLANTKARVKKEKIERFNKKLSESKLCLGCCINDFTSSSGNLYYLDIVTDLSDYNEYQQEKIIDAFSFGFSEYSIIVSVKDFRMKKIAVMCINAKGGFTEFEYWDDDLTQSHRYGMNVVNKDVEEIGDYCEKEFHKKFLMRTVI